MYLRGDSLSLNLREKKLSININIQRSPLGFTEVAHVLNQCGEHFKIAIYF